MKFRCLHILPLAFLPMLAACSQTELLDAPAEGIAYDVTTVNSVRASQTYSSANLPGSFKVWANKESDGSSYFAGDIVERTGTAWADKTATRFWPVGQALRFTALVNGYDNLDATAKVIKGYAVKAQVAEQEDLMYAVAPGQTAANASVSMSFRHALAQVAFLAKNNTGLAVTVKSVAIGHLNGTGDYTLPTASSLSSTGSWTPTGSADSKYTVTLPSEVSLPTDATVATNLTGATNATVMALIPQTQAAWNPEASGAAYNGAYIEMGVKIAEPGTGGKTVYEGTVAIPFKAEWSEGRSYAYTIVFGAGGHGGWTADPSNPQAVLNTIGYTVDVSDYQTAGGSNVDVTGYAEGQTPGGEAAEEDPANPLTKFSRYNLTRVDTRSGSDNTFTTAEGANGALYQWGRNHGYVSTAGIFAGTEHASKLTPGFDHWLDALGTITEDEDGNVWYPRYLISSQASTSFIRNITVASGYYDCHFSIPYPSTDISLLTGNKDKFIINGVDLVSPPLDYWAFGYNNDEIWTQRATTCGYTESNPCPEGWRLPTEEELKAIAPSSNSLENEIRKSGDTTYAIRWECKDGEGLEVKALVVEADTQMSTVDWNSKSVVTRLFPFTGSIEQTVDKDDNNSGVGYAFPHHHGTPTMEIKKENNKYYLSITPGTNTGATFGGYWAGDSKSALTFTTESGTASVAVAENQPAVRALALRPVKE